MLCSLCGKKKKVTPLNMKDIVFGNYVMAMRRLGLSKHTERLGVCGSCMKNYRKMRAQHQNKMLMYGFLAVVFASLYLYFTNNILFSLLIGLLVLCLSAFSYCPPLEE